MSNKQLEHMSSQIHSKNELINFEIYLEDDLTWEQHSKIHKALNIAYGYRTKSFIDKSYAHCIPKIRILYQHESKVIAHTAIFDVSIQIEKNMVAIAGIGLTLSLQPYQLLGFTLRKKAIEIAALADYPCAIGRVRNNQQTKKTLAPLVHTFLDIPLIGNTTRSHDWETLAIYNTGGDKDLVESLVTHFKKTGYIQIEGEIF